MGLVPSNTVGPKERVLLASPGPNRYNQHKMGEFFARDYQGGAFQLFGSSHLVSLGLILALCLLIWRLRERFSRRGRVWMRWGLFLLIYACEGSWQVWMLLSGQWTPQGMLPFWLCSVTSWTIPLLLIFKSRTYYEWAYFMGVIGAGMALATPDLTIYGFPHFRFIEFLTLHGAILLAVTYMTAVECFRPVWASLPRVIAIANLYWLLCALVNRWLGSNYGYTQGKLPTPSLLDVLGPYPWYLLSMEALGIGLCLLLYLPWAWRDWRAKRRLHA
jgi:hypothetical integral membrane protein (TIGR02206 family)